MKTFKVNCAVESEDKIVVGVYKSKRGNFASLEATDRVILYKDDLESLIEILKKAKDGL